MSITSTLARRLVVAALVLTAIAAAMIAGLVATATGAHAPAVAVQPAPSELSRVADDRVDLVSEEADADAALLAAIVGPGVDLSTAQADALLLWADLTCESFTAEVPVAVQTRTLMDALGITGPEAREFVNRVAVVHCLLSPAPVVEDEVAEQSPQEAIGGARCDDPEQVVVAIEDGEYVCGNV